MMNVSFLSKRYSLDLIHYIIRLAYITPYQLTALERLDSMVEHRNKFNLDFCELNIFETHSKAEDFHLKFDGFTITSMLRGRKVMHLEGLKDFDYLPGETVMAQRDMLMRIDFPDAEVGKPTQCTALVIDESYLSDQLDRINELHKGSNENGFQFNLQDLVLKNNDQLASISSKMIRVLSGNDPLKQFEADLILRELVLSLIRIQNLRNAEYGYRTHSNRGPLEAIFSYINTNLSAEIKVDELCRLVGMSKSSLYRLFTEEYGVSPAQLVLDERLKYAKELLVQHADMKVKEVAYASGFNDPNYFNRAFRKAEGCTPLAYRSQSSVSQADSSAR